MRKTTPSPEMTYEDIRLHAEGLWMMRRIIAFWEAGGPRSEDWEEQVVRADRLESRLLTILPTLGGGVKLADPFKLQWPGFVLTFFKSTGRIEIERATVDQP